MPLLSVRGLSPRVSENSWIAPNAMIIGDVVIEEHTSIWFNVVLRGDVNSIFVGKNTNIQDGVIVHATYKKHATYIGNYVSIGHRAVIHGCHLADYSFVGIGAIILDGAKIPSETVVAAGALIAPHKTLKPRMLYAGVPAKPIRELRPDELDAFIYNTPEQYSQIYKNWY